MSQHLPQSKRDKIVYLLDHWDDIFSPPVSGYGRSTGDDSPHLSPMSKHASVVELARCLAVLQVEAPVQHAHLKAFHCAEWRVSKTAKWKSFKGGWRQIANPRPDHEEDWDRKRERLKPAWIRDHKVERAQERLEQLFRGQVFIPEPLWLALTKSSAEIAELERSRPVRSRVAA